MRRVALAAFTAVLLNVWMLGALAQTSVAPCTTSISGGIARCTAVSASNPLPVSATVTPSGTQDTNIVSIGGNVVTTTLPVSGSISGTGTAGTAASGVLTVQGIASMTPVQVAQATAASLNATVVGTGAAGTAATGVVTVQGIASMTPVQVSQATAGNLNATVVGTGTFAVQVSGNSFTNITTNTDTNVKGSAGTLVGFTINTIGTASTVKFFNDADGTCSSGLVGTYATLVQNFIEVPAAMGTGICVQTAGAGAADITVFWR